MEKLSSQKEEWTGKKKKNKRIKSVDTRDSFDINFVTSDGCNPESLVCLYS
jgi:hypothetical protein